MFKFILISLILSSILNAKTVTMKYNGELSLFGKVASAKIKYFNDGENYSIELKGRGTGIVGALTSDRIYTYQSKGKVLEDGTLIPMQYNISHIDDKKKSWKSYIIDRKKSVIKEIDKKEEKISESYFDHKTFSFKRKENIEKKEKSKIIKGVFENDMVSMFFNPGLNLLSMKIGETKIIKALGSPETEQGVRITLISKKQNRYKFKSIMEKDYLKGNESDLYFILDSDNMLYETKMDGVVFFGDAVVKRI